MLNKDTIYYLNRDKNTGSPILKQKYTPAGKEVFEGQLTWKSSRKDKEKEGKYQYGRMNFSTWEKSVFETLQNNPKDGFKIEGELQPNNYKNRDGKMVYAFGILIAGATIVAKQDKPVPSFHEADSSEESDDIPF